MKRFSANEIKEKGLKVKFYDWYELYANYRVVNEKEDIIGYITSTTAKKLPEETFIKKSFKKIIDGGH